jgi:hypothetical protein
MQTYRYRQNTFSTHSSCSNGPCIDLKQPRLSSIFLFRSVATQSTVQMTLFASRSLSDNKIGGLNFLERAFHGQLNRHSKRLTSWFLLRIHLALPSFNTHRWDLCWFSGLSRRQNMHPFQIVGHGHQLPFARGRLQAS